MAQAERSHQAARDLGVDQDEEVFGAVLKRLAKSTTGVAFGRIPKVIRDQDGMPRDLMIPVRPTSAPDRRYDE